MTFDPSQIDASLRSLLMSFPLGNSIARDGPTEAFEVNQQEIHCRAHRLRKTSDPVMNVSKVLKAGQTTDEAAQIPGRKRRPTSWSASVVSLTQQMLSVVQMI